jgi:type VI secretion system secreted protein VgrG
MAEEQSRLSHRRGYTRMQVRAFLSLDALSRDADVVRFRATEGLAALFDVDVVFACDTPDLDLDAALWRPATLSVLDDAGVDPRWFHGVVEEADYLATRAGRFHYRVRLRPRLHGLAYRSRSRIFQDKSSVAVIERVLRDAGLDAAGFDWAGLTARYGPRPYRVQYRESELAFVSRLLEDEGIFWRFEHSQSDHVMVFGDDPSAHALVAGDPVIVYARAEHQGRERVTDVVYTVGAMHDAWRSRDWNPTNPDRPREGQHAAEGEGGYGVDEYPGRFDDDPDALRMATRRLEAARVDGAVLEGRTNVRRAMPGKIFTLAGVQQADLCRDWLVTRVEHRYVDRGLAGEGGAAATYDLHFKAIPSDVAFRPALATPKPRAWMKDSAVITGPSSEEIHVDDMGRVKVHLYWDREGAVDDTATCWMRVQQQNTSGAMILPRVGWEVSVGYFDGDPDRPVVLQKLYNRETMPPYEQPSNSTQSALQTATSPGGGSTNEIRLQDGNGGMEFFVHASRDLRVVAGHDLAETIDVDASEEVGVDLSNTVGANQSVHVGGDASSSVTGACTAEVAGSRTVTIGGSDDWGVKTCQTLAVDGSRSETISGMMNVLANTVTETFNASCARTVGGALAINSAIAIAESVGGSKREQVGAVRLEIVRKSYAESVHTMKTLVSGAAIIKSGADIQASAQGALAYNVAGPIVEQCGDAWNLGARAVVVTTGNLDFKAGGSSLTCSAGSIKFKGGGLSVKGTVSVKLKGNIDFT